MKSIDPEFSALVKRVIEQNAEVLKRLAEFDAEEETDVAEGASVVEEIVIEEVKAEDVAAAIDEAIAENAESTEAAVAEEAPIEAKATPGSADGRTLPKTSQ